MAARWHLCTNLSDECCSSIRVAFISLYYYDIFGETDVNQCLYNTMSISIGTYALISSSLILKFLFHSVTTAAALKKDDDDIKSPKIKVSRPTFAPGRNLKSVIKASNLEPASHFTDRLVFFLYHPGPQNNSESCSLGIEASLQPHDTVWNTKNSEKIEYESVEHFM